MAPELIARKKTDQRIDTFSFAVTCFEAYTKALPWPSSDTMEAAMQRINASAKDIRKLVPRIDPQVANAIMKGLEKDPQDRWRTMRLMVNELRAAGERLGLIPEEPAVDDAEN